jgi:septal ring factor EnvC (AmiA/AmiB activator)
MNTYVHFEKKSTNGFFSLEERLNDRFSLIDARFVALEQAIYDVREDVADLRTSMRAFAVSLDVLTKSMSEMRMEYSAINIQLARHEEWIQKLADKAGVKFA